MKNKELNIISNIKMIESLKAQLLCIIGRFFSLLTKGTNVVEESILECISKAIIILYVLAEKLGYSFQEVDKEIDKDLKRCIKEGNPVETDDRKLSRLRQYINDRID